MFFFLSIAQGADYLHGLMWFTFRLLVVFLFPLAAVVAQEEPSPSPTPEASPAASPEPASSPADATATPESSPTPEASPAPESSPAPEASPSPASDIIPLEGQPAIGAPLETSDLAPDQAMPDEAFVDPNAIVPNELPPAAPVAAESAEEKARQLSIRYKEVRTQVDKDPKVVSLFQQAEEAKTQEDKRAALREYYRLLFKKMISIDKSLTDRCKIMEEAYLRRLAQERLEPTIPLNPPPTPAPIN